MSAVAILPARGGSRRIPRKNIALFRGRPMISYPIAAAKECGLFDSIWISTEDGEIARLAPELGVRWIPRPHELAEINAPDCGTQEVMRHALKNLEYAGATFDYACCIYPCAPMMTANDLRAGFSFLQCQRYGAFACIPGWFYFGLAQDFLSGSRLTDEDTMPLPPNKRYIDINTPGDWVRAELMYASWHRRLEGDTDGLVL